MERFTSREGTLRARRLRKDMTPEERLLWLYLRREQLGAAFRRQQPLGFYIADFVCFEARLVVEIDGAHHAGLAEREYDEARGEYLRARSFKVLRFWNWQVNEDLPGVLERIRVGLTTSRRAERTREP